MAHYYRKGKGSSLQLLQCPVCGRDDFKVHKHENYPPKYFCKHCGYILSFAKDLDTPGEPEEML